MLCAAPVAMRLNADLAQARFARAMTLVGSEFVDKLMYYAKAWLPARSIVDQAIASRFTVRPLAPVPVHDCVQVDASGEIVVLDSQCPWKGHLFEIEESLALSLPLPLLRYT